MADAIFKTPDGMSEEDYTRLLFQEAARRGRALARRCDFITGEGYRCGNNAVGGRDRCRLHGGATSHDGIANNAMKKGRYSKFLPANLRDSYEKGLHDEELLSLHEEVALMKARLGELAARLETGEGGAPWWAVLAHQFVTLKAAVDEDRSADVQAALDRLKKTIEQGACNEHTWQLIRETLDGTQKLAAAEWKRLVDLRQFISTPKAVALVMSVVASVQEHVKDRRVLSLIQADVNRIVMSPQQARDQGAPNPTRALSEYGRRDEDAANETRRQWEATEAAMGGLGVDAAEPPEDTEDGRKSAGA